MPEVVAVDVDLGAYRFRDERHRLVGVGDLRGGSSRCHGHNDGDQDPDDESGSGVAPQ